MALVKKGQVKLQPCAVCGQPSAGTICPHCEARIRGEAVDKKREAEKKGRADRE